MLARYALAALGLFLGPTWLLADEQQIADKAKLLGAFEKAALTNPGDPQIGRKLFLDEERTKCAICHRVGETGGKIGPELTQIGGKFDRPHLIESLLEPSRQIVEGYRSSTLVTAKGEVISGLVKERSEERLRVYDATGKAIDLASPDIEEEKTSDTSIMPEGLATGLSAEDFTHLIAYLESLRSGADKYGGAVSGPVRLPQGFEIRTVATGLDGAVAMELTPDGRILICEQTGALRIIESAKLLPRPFVTLPVLVEWERGLIGVTIDPNFDKTPYVYVCYVAKDPYPHHIISRFLADGNVAKPGSEEILLTGDDQRQLGGNVPAGHQGGGMHFGPDGCLYIGIGEQTAGLPAQKLNTLQGKILRIRADGTIPTDNPFYNQTAGKYRAIYAYGLRNPFTFAFHPAIGDLLINDVGGVFEEINRGKAGANYGWPTVEHGPTDDPRFVGPVHTYPQASIGGGVFIEASSHWPSSWHGKYLFADFVHGWIHAIDPKLADARTHNNAETFAEGLRRPVDLRLGENGVLYVLLRNAWVIDDKFQLGTGSLLAISYQGH